MTRATPSRYQPEWRRRDWGRSRRAVGHGTRPSATARSSPGVAPCPRLVRRESGLEARKFGVTGFGRPVAPPAVTGPPALDQAATLEFFERGAEAAGPSEVCGDLMRRYEVTAVLSDEFAQDPQRSRRLYDRARLRPWVDTPAHDFTLAVAWKNTPVVARNASVCLAVTR
jgi:hypothetical protein